MRQYLFKGKVRTSTLILVGVFVLVFLLYLLVRPNPVDVANRHKPVAPTPPKASATPSPAPKRSSAPPKPSASVGPASPHPSRSATPSGRPPAATSGPATADSPGQSSGQGPAQGPAPKPPAQLTPQPRLSP